MRYGLIFFVLSSVLSTSGYGVNERVFIYSDVEYIADAGDTVGRELELHVRGTKVCGTLRDHQGGPPPDVGLSGTVNDGRVVLRGKLASIDVTVTGVMGKNVFRGELRYDMGKQKNLFTVRLPRVRGRPRARKGK